MNGVQKYEDDTKTAFSGRHLILSRRVAEPRLTLSPNTSNPSGTRPPGALAYLPGLKAGVSREVIDKTSGFHVWTDDEILKFEERWAIGTRERLAFAVLRYTGLRRGDAVKLGHQHFRDNLIMIVTEKQSQPAYIPVHPELRRIIDASQTGDLTLIVGNSGQAMKKESFGNWFKTACKAAGVPGSAHGLRKAGATRAAEQGATESQLEAIFGWSGGKMAAHYTKTVNRERLAREFQNKTDTSNPAPVVCAPEPQIKSK